jgi:CheY-like chemotaxis protein
METDRAYRFPNTTEVGQALARECAPAERPDGDGVGLGLCGQRERPLVLLVDDEASVRKVVRLMLEYNGFTVISAASGAEALARLALNDGAVRALVTDQNMPGMSGTELVSHMLQRGIDLPVLFVSGQPPSAMVSDGHASAPRRFLAKPFTPDALLREMTTLLRDARRDAKS